MIEHHLEEDTHFPLNPAIMRLPLSHIHRRLILIHAGDLVGLLLLLQIILIHLVVVDG